MRSTMSSKENMDDDSNQTPVVEHQLVPISSHPMYLLEAPHDVTPEHLLHLEICAEGHSLASMDPCNIQGVINKQLGVALGLGCRVDHQIVDDHGIRGGVVINCHTPDQLVIGIEHNHQVVRFE